MDSKAVVNFFNAGIIQTGDFQLHKHKTEPNDDRRVVDRKQEFLFDFYGQALRQSEITFRMSLIFMAIGALTILAGAIMALANISNGQNYVATISGLSGAIIGARGAAFAFQANRARKHLTQQADRIYDDLSSERSFEQALDMVNGIRHRGAQDRLRAIAALRALGVEPPANEVTQLLMRSSDDEAPS